MSKISVADAFEKAIEALRALPENADLMEESSFAIRWSWKFMPHPGNKIHIPLSERQAVTLLGKVKPTPRPGAAKKKAAKKKRG
jgi:hypothetical protein